MRQLSGAAQYRAFIPKPLPPDPQVQMDQEMWKLLSDADRALGRLDGVTEMLPNPDLFVAMYVRKEAVLSSQIEGTQASLVEGVGNGAKVLMDGVSYAVFDITSAAFHKCNKCTQALKG